MEDGCTFNGYGKGVIVEAMDLIRGRSPRRQTKAALEKANVKINAKALVSLGRRCRYQIEATVFKDAIDGAKTPLKQALDQAAISDDEDARVLAKSLFRDWDGLWTFADNPGVAPTNNHAERMIRPAVIIRKLSGGTRVDSGARFFERTLSVCQTLKQQGRNIGQTLHDYLIAHLTLMPAPAIIL